MTKQLDRRQFIKAAGVGAASLALGCSPRHTVGTAGRRPRVFADLHVHAFMNKWNRTTPFGQSYSLLSDGLSKALNKTRVSFERAWEVGVDLLCVPHYNVFDEVVSMPTTPSTLAPATARRMVRQVEYEVATNLSAYARVAHNRDELGAMLRTDKNGADYRIAVVHAMEGGHVLAGDLDNVTRLREWGVAYVTATHFFDKGVGATANALPFFEDRGFPSPHRGLLGFGHELLSELENNGIIIDVTHMTSSTLNDTLQATNKPVMATHAAARTLSNRPYSLYDEQIVEIAGRGGLIGVILVPYFLSNYGTLEDAVTDGTLYDVIATIRHIVKLCGTHKHVAIGSDFGAFVHGPREVDDIADIDVLRALIINEFDDAEIADDILANNAISFLLENWGPDA